jgi:Ala-tRNA(Pro) deacylase
MSGIARIHEFLRAAKVPYTVVPHHSAFSAQAEAAAAHIHGRDWAKVVVCLVDGQPIEALLPAPLLVDLKCLLELSGGKEIRLAREEELRELFPGCEPGAIPPFGELFGQPVFADVRLASESDLVFGAGTHSDAIAMRWSDFARTVRPIVGRFAAPRPDHVGEYRLSFRE